jgi:hypothetical protein
LPVKGQGNSHPFRICPTATLKSALQSEDRFHIY